MQKKQPFKYGEVVSKNIFLNRSNEIKRLHNNFSSGISSILISPRRWGKTSLVKKATETYKDKNTRFVFIDCFRISSKEQFLEEYASRTIEACYSKTEERLKLIQDFFKGIMPELGVATDVNSEINLKLKWKGTPLPESEILNLPQTLAKKKKLQVVVCIDEFQNIANFEVKQRFQKVLRSYWQHHSDVSYCLYGSKRHLMVKFFTKSSMPFYKFGDTIILNKIEKKHWIKYIQRRFKLFDKTISADFAERIATDVQCHSYYVQQLAHIIFIYTKEETTEQAYRIALRSLLEQNQIIYYRTVEDLSHPQLEFLRALTDGVTSFYSKKVNAKYNLGSVGNIKRIKEALETKEVIDRFTKIPTFVDPVFELWFKTYYLNRPLFAEE